jgi:hypothetical protein
MNSARLNAFRNAACGFLAGYGAVAFFCFWQLVRQWANLAPIVPDVPNGLVIPHNEHGHITYFSAFQATSAALLFSTSVPLGMLGVLLSPKKNIRSSSGRLSFRAIWDQDDPKGLYKPAIAAGAVAAPAIVFLLGPHLVTWLNGIGFVLTF